LGLHTAKRSASLVTDNDVHDMGSGTRGQTVVL
jgi:hypothetical protein